MLWLVVLMLASTYLVACGRPGDLSEEQVDRITAAEEEAAVATKAVDRLSDELEDLESELISTRSAADRRAERVSQRLDKLTERLAKGVERLRSSIASA